MNTWIFCISLCYLQLQQKEQCWQALTGIPQTESAVKCFPVEENIKLIYMYFITCNWPESMLEIIQEHIFSSLIGDILCNDIYHMENIRQSQVKKI